MKSEEATAAVIDALDGLDVPYMVVGWFSRKRTGPAPEQAAPFEWGRERRFPRGTRRFHRLGQESSIEIVAQYYRPLARRLVLCQSQNWGCRVRFMRIS